MARPVVPAADKRSVKFTLQLTQPEKEQLIKLAETCGKAPAVLAREKIFRGRFPEPKTPKIELYTYTELKRIGVNLNQLTRRANAGIISTALLTTLFKLEQKLDALTAKLIYDSQSKDR